MIPSQSQYSNATTERITISAMSGNQTSIGSSIGLTIYETESMRSSTIGLTTDNESNFGTVTPKTPSVAEIMDHNYQHVLNEIDEANRLIEKMKYQSALKILEGANLALLSRSENLEIHILLGKAKCRYKMSRRKVDVEKALEYCNQALLIEPENHSAILLKIECLLKLELFFDVLEQIRIARFSSGQENAYEDFLRKCQTISSTELDEFVKQAYDYIEREEYDIAFGYFNLALFLKRNPEWLGQIGIINVENRRYIDGISELEEALASWSMPTDEPYKMKLLQNFRHALFIAYMEIDQDKKAAKLLMNRQNVCERCILCNERQNDLPQILLGNAENLTNGRQFDRAIENVEISLEMNWTFDAWQKKAEMLENCKKFTQLLCEANNLLKKQPTPTAEILLKIQKHKIIALNGLGRHYDALLLTEKCAKEYSNDLDLNRLQIRIKESFINPITGFTPSNTFWQQWEQRSKLPVWEKREEFMSYLEDDNINVIVVTGGTGSGKTTQIPQWCAEFSNRKYQWQFGLQRRNRVVCTQTTRKATTKSAQRLCRELGLDIGEEIGYVIRFKSRFNRDKCQIKYCTEGILLAEACTNPSFHGYSIIICDEVHTRKVDTDMLLAALKRALSNGHRLKMVIMSATMTFCIEKFRDFFGNISTVNIPDKQIFSVTIEKCPMESLLWHNCVRYSRRTDDHMECRVFQKIKEICESGVIGHILVFLAGINDIKHLEYVIKNGIQNLIVISYHSKQNDKLQEKIFEEGPINNRKCILATDIAETSLTIPGVGFVIDCGRCKRSNFIHHAMASYMQWKRISKSSAIQRAGRAGRTQDGICYIMYDENNGGEDGIDFLGEMDEPEILRSDLVPIAFKMVQMKLNLNEFIDRPSIVYLEKAQKILRLINAIDENNQLTKEGQLIGKFPELDPRMAKVLIASSMQFNCSREMLIIVSMLSEMDGHDLFDDEYQFENDQKKYELSKKKFTHPMGRLFVYLNIFLSFERDGGNKPYQQREWCKENFFYYTVLERALKLRNQLQQKMRNLGLKVTKLYMNINDPICIERITRAFLAGYYFQVADIKCFEPLYAHQRYGSIFKGLSHLELIGKTYSDVSIDFERITGCAHQNELPAWTVAFQRIVKRNGSFFYETPEIPCFFMENAIVVRSREWVKEAAKSNNAPMNSFDFESIPYSLMCCQCMPIPEEETNEEGDEESGWDENL